MNMWTVEVQREWKTSHLVFIKASGARKVPTRLPAMIVHGRNKVFQSDRELVSWARMGPIKAIDNVSHE